MAANLSEPKNNRKGVVRRQKNSDLFNFSIASTLRDTQGSEKLFFVFSKLDLNVKLNAVMKK